MKNLNASNFLLYSNIIRLGKYRHHAYTCIILLLLLNIIYQTYRQRECVRIPIYRVMM